MRKRLVCGMAIVLLSAGSLAAQPASQGNGEPTYVLPDMQTVWASYSLQDIRIVPANSSDRLVSCDDWTQVDPNPITGQRVLSFTLGSPNLGSGHLRTRRVAYEGGWLWYQNVSLMTGGTCSAEEYPIAWHPNQGGRWLPLGKFALYEITEEGGLGTRVACQIKRWCCLVSTPTCQTNPPCSLPCQGDCINAGTRDVYPFHWLDQFIPIQGVPTGFYYVEHEINPGGVLIENDYSNNYFYFAIYLDQEAGTVQVVWAPDQPICPAGTQ